MSVLGCTKRTIRPHPRLSDIGKSGHWSALGLNGSVANGRVEMWRGGCRSNISVAASFVWRCLTGATMTPFPHPAHRTGLADLPHPALGQDITPARVTPSAVSEHFSEFDRLPNLLSLTTCCVGPELRPLPSTGITRLQRYYEPLRHPKAPGLSLAGVRLLNRLSTPRGLASDPRGHRGMSECENVGPM